MANDPRPANETRTIPKERIVGDLNLDPITDEPGSHPVGTGVGAAGGAITGAAVGALGGPIGAAAGAVVGAIAGGLAGHSLGEAINPTAGGEPEQHEIGTGVGAAGGAMTGAAIGAVAPVGYRRSCFTAPARGATPPQGGELEVQCRST